MFFVLFFSVKLGEYQAGAATFEKALDLAKSQGKICGFVSLTFF